MRRLLAMAIFAMMMAFGFAGVAEETEFDPAADSRPTSEFGSTAIMSTRLIWPIRAAEAST